MGGVPLGKYVGLNEERCGIQRYNLCRLLSWQDSILAEEPLIDPDPGKKKVSGANRAFRHIGVALEHDTTSTSLAQASYSGVRMRRH